MFEKNVFYEKKKNLLSPSILPKAPSTISNGFLKAVSCLTKRFLKAAEISIPGMCWLGMDGLVCSASGG
jgi:hypothetical protein